MINASKYYRTLKSGGNVGGSILEQLLQLPQEQQRQILQAFGDWAQEQGIDITSLLEDPLALEQYLERFLSEQQGALMAKYGAKLNDSKKVKLLKNPGRQKKLLKGSKLHATGCGCSGMKLHKIGGKLIEICE